MSYTTWPGSPDTQALDSYPHDLLFLDRYYAMLGDSLEVNRNYIFQYK